MRRGIGFSLWSRGLHFPRGIACLRRRSGNSVSMRQRLTHRLERTLKSGTSAGVSAGVSGSLGVSEAFCDSSPFFCSALGGSGFTCSSDCGCFCSFAGADCAASFFDAGVGMLCKCSTTPDGRISLTRKSVYLTANTCFSSAPLQCTGRETVPFLHNAREARSIGAHKLRNANLQLFRCLRVV